MLEPKNNPNPRLIVDPSPLVRWLMSKRMSKSASASRIAKSRVKLEKQRRARNAPHRVEYFHQFDDPYSHLTAQVLARFAARYDIEIVPHLVRATGGKAQPELEKLAIWARRDAELVAPHYGLASPNVVGMTPEKNLIEAAASLLAGKPVAAFLDDISNISIAVWEGDPSGELRLPPNRASVEAALNKGSDRLKELGHYSGATFYYAGEWYWGVDRLFHLEQRLMDLGARQEEGADYLVPRPEIDLHGVDASKLTLHFYPSLNSPYTSIIYDRTIEMTKSCGINLVHKPVLPMIMRGVAITPAKGDYILFDTKREADFFGVPFGPVITPIGMPTRRAYSLMAWARGQGKDTDLLSSLLRLAFAQAVPLNKEAGMARAVKEAGLNWNEASRVIGNDGWKDEVAGYQQEMVEGMGLWGVPSYRLSGPDGEPDLSVWGQDRLWLVAAEIARRVKNPGN